MRSVLAWVIGCVLCLPPLEGGVLSYVGPEVYAVRRIRDGGTVQTGCVTAVHTGIDGVHCRWYAGGEYLYGTGPMHGSTGTKKPLSSYLTDTFYEVRLGYGFFSPCSQARTTFFIPFGGWGSFQETNAYFPPSQVLCTLTDSFTYTTIGFLSGVNFLPLLSMGINFKTKFMLAGVSAVQEEGEDEGITMRMRNAMQLRLDIPLYLKTCPEGGWGVQIVPFYEFRHFGGRLNYPYNYKDTKLYLWGARIALDFAF